jgi:catechol 2,3-dioxygenase-like lactoylglutathione lyase family enzyme
VRFSQVRLLVDDVGSCYRFYRDVLGLQPTFGVEDDMYASFAGQLALFVRSGQEEVVGLRGPGDGAVVCLAVDDLDAAIERVSPAGGELLGPPVARADSGLRVVYLRDPAGNLVELHEEIPMEDA